MITLFVIIFVMCMLAILILGVIYAIISVINENDTEGDDDYPWFLD